MGIVVIAIVVFVLVYLIAFSILHLTSQKKKSYEQTQEQMVQGSNFETLPENVSVEEVSLPVENLEIVLPPMGEYLIEEPLPNVKVKKPSAKKKTAKKKPASSKKKTAKKRGV